MDSLHDTYQMKNDIVILSMILGEIEFRRDYANLSKNNLLFYQLYFDKYLIGILKRIMLFDVFGRWDQFFIVSNTTNTSTSIKII